MAIISNTTLAEAAITLRNEFVNDPNVQAVQAYAAEHHEAAVELLQQQPYKALSDSVGHAIDNVLQPVKTAARNVEYTVSAMTGVPVEQLSSTSSEMTVVADLSSGDTTFTAWLKSDQQQMSGSNTTDIDYGVLAHLSYASKNVYMHLSNDSDGLSASQKDIAKNAYKAVVSKQNITISQYCQNLLDAGADHMDECDRRFLEQIRDSSRYGNLTVDHVAGDDGDSRGVNSFVMAIGTGDGHGIISVQGTDGRVVDWQENGKFSGTDPSDEEKWVTSVANIWASEYDTIDLTGHSQGGREAVTAAAFMDSENQDKIQKIINNDGPGYAESFITSHRDELNAIADKVTNIMPYPRSGVGTLLTHVGDETNVVALKDTVADGEGEKINQHVSTTWVYDPSTGKIQIAEVGTDLLSDAIETGEDVINPILESLKVIMGDDAVAELLGDFIKLGDNGEGILEFGELAKLDKVGGYIALFEKAKESFTSGLATIREKNLNETEKCLYVIADELDHAITYTVETLDNIELALGIVTLVCPQAVEITAPIMAAIEDVKGKLEIVQKVCQFIKIAIDIVAYVRETKARKERQDYLAQNDEMCVSKSVLYAAIDDLNDVKTALETAYAWFKTAMTHYKQKITEMILDAAGVESEKVSWAYLTYNSGLIHAGFANFDGIGVLDDATKLQNAINALQNVIRDMSSILEDSNDSSFTVNPSMLSSAGSDGEAAVEMIRKEKGITEEQLTNLFTVCKGPDSGSFAARVNGNKEWMDEGIQDLKRQFAQLISIAGCYSQFQVTAVEGFQYINL